MIITKYYLVRILQPNSEVLYNIDGSRMEFDKLENARKKIAELEEKNQYWLVGWMKEEIDI